MGSSERPVFPLPNSLPEKMLHHPLPVDSGNGLRCFNLLDAQLDAVYAAMSALHYKDLKLVVTKMGWPSKGDEEVGASIENAAAYNSNLVRRMLSGAGEDEDGNEEEVGASIENDAAYNGNLVRHVLSSAGEDEDGE